MHVFKDGLLYVSASGAPDPAEIERAKDWIRRYGRQRQSFNRRYTSYNLKHCAERWIKATGLRYGGMYVSNGAFIQAALDLGYRAEPVGNLGDALFNMAVPCVGAPERREAGFRDL